MAEPEALPPLPGAERIRAIKDEAGRYKAFDAYPWTKDRTFMVRLMPINVKAKEPCS